jgi:hypothetical protein
MVFHPTRRARVRRLPRLSQRAPPLPLNQKRPNPNKTTFLSNAVSRGAAISLADHALRITHYALK